MPLARRVRLKTSLLRAAALLIMAAPLIGAHPARAQETVFIGASGRPAIEVDLSVLNGAATPRPRISRPGPPDILPYDSANGPQARAATTARLLPAPSTISPAPGAPMPLAPVAPQTPLPAATSAAPNFLTAKPLSSGLTAAPAPSRPAPRAELQAAEPPKAITPAKAAPVQAAPAPPAGLPRVAALPAGPAPSAPAAGAAVTIMFTPGAPDLTPVAAAQLDALIGTLTPQQRVQLKSHASGAENDAEARRIALKRALAARSHLLAGGIESTRIDVRALGPAGDGGPDDRLDVIVVAQ